MPFEKGVSGNPNGRPKGTESKIKKLFKEYADAEDIQDLFEVLKDKAMAGDMDAIKTLLAYLIGKPVETVNQTLDASINDKRVPSWFVPKEMECKADHISITSTEAKNELQ